MAEEVGEEPISGGENENQEQVCKANTNFQLGIGTLLLKNVPHIQLSNKIPLQILTKLSGSD